MTKISSAEFKTWSRQFEAIFREIEGNPNWTWKDENDKKVFPKLAALSIFYTEKGVLAAITSGLGMLIGVGLKDDIPLSAFNGETFSAWGKKIATRLKEHCIANGHYNPNSPPELASLKEKRKKVNQVLKDKNQFYSLLAYANQEEYQYITSTVEFVQQISEIIPKEYQEDDEIPQEMEFLVVDYVGQVEKLISQKEQFEKENKPSKNSPNSPTPNSKTPAEYKNNLETEINRLQQQIKELGSKIKNTDNSTQKETYQKVIDSLKNILIDRQKEKQKLDKSEKSQQSSANNDNKLLYWAIGLGITAVVIGLFCLILMLAKKKKKTVINNYLWK